MENHSPPPLPPLPLPLPGKNLRIATALNVFLPGAGLLYLGKRVLGACLMAAFLICLLAMLGIFLAGYYRYFQLALGGNILEGDRIERLGGGFHPRWLLGLAGAGGLIHVASMILLAAARRGRERDHSRR